jgi:hypothetical protein
VGCGGAGKSFADLLSPAGYHVAVPIRPQPESISPRPAEMGAASREYTGFEFFSVDATEKIGRPKGLEELSEAFQEPTNVQGRNLSKEHLPGRLIKSEDVPDFISG